MFEQVHKLLLFLALLWALAPSSTQAQVINCPSGFASSGDCGVSYGVSGNSFLLSGSNNSSSPALVGSQVDMIPTGASHAALSLNYQTPVNDQAFTARFRFVPNGQNIAFVIQNSNNNPTFDGAEFSAGAGCEAGFFQGYNQSNPPNNVFALELDSYSPLTNGGSFTYSSAQIYTSNPFVQCPCIGGVGVCGTNNSDSGNITKISTSPVPLNSPYNFQNATTGHTYSATVTYNGSNLTLNLYDVTAGGSCPGTKCFTQTWNNVAIPASVSGNTAWVGFTAATGLISNSPLYVESFVYNTGTTTSSLTQTPTPTVTPTHTPTPTPTPTPTVTATHGRRRR